MCPSSRGGNTLCKKKYQNRGIAHIVLVSQEVREEWKNGRKGSRAGGSPVQETGSKGRMEGKGVERAARPFRRQEVREEWKERE
jgi:hypothetical protein